MKVIFSRGTPQSCATFSVISRGGARLDSSTRVAREAVSRYSNSENNGSLRASARPGPEPSAKNADFPSPCESAQPAYWLARQAITGSVERTQSSKGNLGWAPVGAIATVPIPPRQISAIARPASIPPRAFWPASIIVSPASPLETATRNRAALAIMRSTACPVSVLILGSLLLKVSSPSQGCRFYFEYVQVCRESNWSAHRRARVRARALPRGPLSCTKGRAAARRSALSAGPRSNVASRIPAWRRVPDPLKLLPRLRRHRIRAGAAAGGRGRNPYGPGKATRRDLRKCRGLRPAGD